jgi:hypothetical protein
MLRVTHLDAVQGASEARTEPYLNTVREYWSWQRSNAPKGGPQQKIFCWGGNIPEQSKLCLDWAGMVRKA